MANKRLAALLALLQILCIAINGVSAVSRCHLSGYLTGKCNRENGSECCVACHRYQQFRCSPQVSFKTPPVLTLNSFVADGDGSGLPYCDGRYHSDRELVVALSSGWLRLDGRARCNRMVRVSANGRYVLAKVVDECDSVNGRDAKHNFELPCDNNVLDASPAVWKALGLGKSIGKFKVTWSDVRIRPCRRRGDALEPM